MTQPHIPSTAIVTRCPMCRADVVRHDGCLYDWKSMKEKRGSYWTGTEHECPLIPVDHRSKGRSSRA